MAYGSDDPLAIPGRKRQAAVGDPTADTTIGPPTVARAPNSPAIPGPTNVAINPTGTDLAQAGALRPQSGPYSASNPAPLIGPDGKLSSPGSTAPRPAPPVSSAAAIPPVGSIAPVRPTPVTAISGDAGVSTTAPLPATSLAGRTLGYGRSVDGVRTFGDSDIPAINTAPSRLTQADNGIGGNIGTEANGGATLTLGAGPLTPPRPDPIAAAQAANATAQMNAASDAASIANRDPRSVLGAAARNAAVDAQSVGGAQGALALQNALKGLSGVPESEVANTAKLGETSLTEGGANSRALLGANTDLQREILAKRPEAKDITLADGTLGVLGPDGRVRPALDASGQPARPQVNVRTTDPAGYSKSLQDNLRLTLGLDPTTGLMQDPNDPNDPKKQRAPTPQELLLASRAAKSLTDEQYGQGDARTGGTTASPTAAATSSSSSTPANVSVDFLKQNSKNTQYRAQFDRKYGAGAAARALGEKA